MMKAKKAVAKNKAIMMEKTLPIFFDSKKTTIGKRSTDSKTANAKGI
jgi:23S rRNA maturation mini-RNase III